MINERSAVRAGSPGRFSGRTAVVTGGASGIGAATVRRLCAEGAAVVIVDVSGDGETVAARAREEGGQALFVAGDVSDEGTWDRAARAAEGTFGPVDVLVSNAFTVDVTPAHEMTLPSWQRQLDVNLTGSFLGFRSD
jgi:glucose 1-dehydrogenase